MVCLVSVCELAWLLKCTLLVTLWPVLFQPVSWPDHHIHISGDTGLVSAGELACSFIWTFLVIQTVASLVSEGELAWFFMCTVLVILWPVLFQMVGLPVF